jgi:hypothetical protein
MDGCNSLNSFRVCSTLVLFWSYVCNEFVLIICINKYIGSTNEAEKKYIQYIISVSIETS